MLSKIDQVGHDAHKGKWWMCGRKRIQVNFGGSSSFLHKKNASKGMKKVEGVKIDDVTKLVQKMNLCYSCDSNVTKFPQEEHNNMLKLKLFIPTTLKDKNENA